MNRKSFRNIWILTMVVIVGMVFVAYRSAEDAKMAIRSRNFDLRNLQVELDNAARRAELLKELDSLTINEKTATRLDILRHLGLEQSGYEFIVNARQVKIIGDANLYQRMVRLSTDIPYANAMMLIDRLHETRKIVINKIEMKRSSQMGDKVSITIEGNIYGLEKNDA